MSADSPLEAEQAFYRAFSSLDVEAMRALWADDPQAFCIHPGGPLIQGKEMVLQSWSEIFTAAAPPTLEYRTLCVEERNGISVHLVEEMIRPSGERSAQATRVMATNVYVLAGGYWRLLAHHASLPMVESGRRREGPALH